MTAITPSQFETILHKAHYNGRTHVLDMVVEVPAGTRASQPEAHLVAWNNHTAESIRLEIIGGWPVVGIRVRERAGSETVFGFGLADRDGRRFAKPGQVCPRCGRTFLPFEVICADGDCADRDQCVQEAGEYKMPAARRPWAYVGAPTSQDIAKEERLAQYRNARNLRREIARRAFERQPGVRSVVAEIRP